MPIELNLALSSDPRQAKLAWREDDRIILASTVPSRDNAPVLAPC